MRAFLTKMLLWTKTVIKIYRIWEETWMGPLVSDQNQFQLSDRRNTRGSCCLFAYYWFTLDGSFTLYMSHAITLTRHVCMCVCTGVCVAVWLAATQRFRWRTGVGDDIRPRPLASLCCTHSHGAGAGSGAEHKGTRNKQNKTGQNVKVTCASFNK